MSYYSDAGMAAAQTGSRNCFLLGPGNIEQAHTPDEFIESRLAEKSRARLRQAARKIRLGADAT